MVAFGEAIGDQAASAFAGLQGAGEKLREGGVGAQDRAVALDRGDGHGRGIEEAGETHLRRAQASSAGSSPGARLRTSVRDGAGRAVMAEGDAVQQPHRQTQPVAALQVEVDLFGVDVPGGPDAKRQQRGGVAGHEIGRA